MYSAMFQVPVVGVAAVVFIGLPFVEGANSPNDSNNPPPIPLGRGAKGYFFQESSNNLRKGDRPFV
jgi:hypothetical protein